MGSTDLGKLKELLDSWEVSYNEDVGNNVTTIEVYGGYAGFFTDFDFHTETGQFKDMGAYE